MEIMKKKENKREQEKEKKKGLVPPQWHVMAFLVGYDKVIPFDDG